MESRKSLELELLLLYDLRRTVYECVGATYTTYHWT